MLKTRTIITSLCLASILGCVSGANVSAANKEYIVHVYSNIIGEDASSAQVTYELQNIDGSVVSSKTSSAQDVAFDPIVLDETDNVSHYYKIVQKDGSSAGLTHDDKTVYVRIKPSENIFAYQDDATYKYINDGSGPHPYHATDEELQGEAYAVYDSTTNTLMFFRDEPGKYTDNQVDGAKTYYAGFELANQGQDDWFRAQTPTWQYYINRDVKKIVFRDAIRPEGAMANWFKNFENVEEADISKLDTSRVGSMYYFFYGASKVDLNLTTLDFTHIAQVASETSIHPLDEFMNHSGQTEFDFNNYAPIDAGSNHGIADMLAWTPLRYLNVENLGIGSSSAEFNMTSCLERVVVGEKYNFYRSHLDIAGNEWLEIETGKIDQFSNFMNDDGAGGTHYIDSGNVYAKGNYVRPICNTTPATFTSKYIKPASPDDDVKNPETNDDLTAANLAIVSIAGLFVVAVLGRAKH
jgi:hypothetical protein